MVVGEMKPVSASTDLLIACCHSGYLSRVLCRVCVIYGRLSIALVRANSRALLAWSSFY